MNSKQHWKSFAKYLGSDLTSKFNTPNIQNLKRNSSFLHFQLTTPTENTSTLRSQMSTSDMLNKKFSF